MLLHGKKMSDVTGVASLPPVVDDGGRLIVTANRGNSVMAEATLATNAVAYSAGDAVGGLMLAPIFPVGHWFAYLESLYLRDLDNQKAALSLLFFDINPAAATVTNNAAFAFNGEQGKVTQSVQIAAADYTTVGGAAFAGKGNLRQGLSGTLSVGAAQNIYLAVITPGTPTYATANALRFRFHFSLQAAPVGNWMAFA